MKISGETVFWVVVKLITVVSSVSHIQHYLPSLLRCSTLGVAPYVHATKPQFLGWFYDFLPFELVLDPICTI